MTELSKREKIILGLLVAVLLGFCIMTYYAFFKDQNEIAFKFEDEPTVPVEADGNSKTKDDKEDIVVYVIGAVKTPGVYSLQEDSRIKDAIEIAGGPLEDADLLILNLAEKLQDEDKLYVPRQGEINKDVQNISDQNFGISSKDDDKVNINTATLEELKTLPGIGPATAQKIIDHRSENGLFKTIEDIKNVSGIGDKKFEQIKEKITAR